CAQPRRERAHHAWRLRMGVGPRRVAADVFRAAGSGLPARGTDASVTNRLLDRLRRLTAAELDWRLRELAHTTGDRLRACVSTPRWDTDDRMRSIAAAVGDRLATQPARFVIDPTQSTQVRDVILARWPDAARDA